jgi:hypothetical protein
VLDDRVERGLHRPGLFVVVLAGELERGRRRLRRTFRLRSARHAPSPTFRVVIRTIAPMPTIEQLIPSIDGRIRELTGEIASLEDARSALGVVEFGREGRARSQGSAERRTGAERNPSSRALGQGCSTAIASFLVPG